MEDVAEPSGETFSLAEEDYTLGNAVCYVLNQDPRVAFCGYSVPHPSENKVNVRLQTTGESSRVVFRDALHDLADMCEHVRETFEASVDKYKAKQTQADADAQPT